MPRCNQYWYKENLPGDLQRYYEGSIVQTAVLKWVLNHDFITTAVPGYTTYAQMEEDVAAGSSPALTPDEIKFLGDRGVKMAMASYCRQCGTCRTGCPKGVDIPALMRVHMYAACYGNLGQALFFNTVQTFLIFFYTDTVRLDPKLVGLAFAISYGVWNAINIF